MSIPLFKKERGGVNPIGPLQNHIYRDPPSSIHTRKYEPVDVGDVMYMNRPDGALGDPTRINDSIKYYARGVNPMVEIDYGNNSGGSVNTSLHNGQTSNPYKVEVVRPPMYPIETLVPLSAPRIHQNYSIASAPRIEPFTVAGMVDQTTIKQPIRQDINQGVIKVNPSITYYEMMDKIERNAKTRPEEITLRGVINPTSSLTLDTRDANVLRSTAVGNTNVYSVTSTAGFTNQTYNPFSLTNEVSQNAIKDLNSFSITSNSTFGNIIVFDPKTNTSLDLASNIKDKHYISVTAAAGAPLVINTNNGKEIVLKDYSYSVVNTNIGNPQLIIQVNQPDIILNRNTPLFAASANLSGVTNSELARSGQSDIKLFQNVPLTSVNSSYQSTIMDSGNLARAGSDTINLIKITPWSSINSNIKSSTTDTNMALLGKDNIKLVNSTNPSSLQTSVSSSANNSEERFRHNQDQVKLNRQTNFGDFQDRNSRPNPNIRQELQIKHKKDQFLQTFKNGHTMNLNKMNF